MASRVSSVTGLEPIGFLAVWADYLFGSPWAVSIMAGARKLPVNGPKI